MLSLRNVTVALDAETERWVRIEAARRGTSVSRFIGDLLRREMRGHDASEAAMSRYWGQSASVQRDPVTPLPKRDELYGGSGVR
jgi:hypothetical protein